MNPALEILQDALLERLLDDFEAEQVKPRVVRIALLRRPICSTPASVEGDEITHDDACDA